MVKSMLISLFKRRRSAVGPETARRYLRAPRLSAGWRRLWRCAALCLFGSLAAAAFSPVAAASRPIKPSAVQQMTILLQDKRSWTPAQKKLDTGLIYEIKRRNGTFPTGLSKLRTGAPVETDGRVLVDIRATVSPELLKAIEELGGTVINRHERFDAIRARLPVLEIEGLAARGDLAGIRQAGRMMLSKINTSEGDGAHRADVARNLFGVDGSGVKVGVLSDSVDELSNLQASGDLPPGVTVLAGQSGNPGTSEGTALLEIVFDLAPGADLFFATANGGEAQFAQNILDLHAAGCDVIVDDALYFAEGVFQDGVVAQAVETVSAAGTLYFSSAGNSGNLNDGTAGVWEGDYVGISLPPPLVGFATSALDFGGGNNSNEMTEQALNDAPFFTLQWADPLLGSGNDFDLFLLDSTLTSVIGASTSVQDGDDDPFEIIASVGVDDSGNRLVVTKFSGDDRFMHLNVHRGLLAFGTDGQIFGHPGAESAVALAATFVDDAGGAGGVFNGTEVVETFSSDGPRRIFFEADGSPVAPAAGAPEGVASIVRQKPDICAADGVSTATPGFEPFFGTSASAPHAAGIAALLKELWPSASVRGFDGLLRSTALDIEAPGFDRDSGSGIIMGDTVLNSVIFADGFESGNTSAWTE